MYAPTGYREDMTKTAGGTTSNQTINKPAGSVNVATGQTTVFITNNIVASTSLVFTTVGTDDTTAKSAIAIPGSGLITIKLNAAATGETLVQWNVINP